MISLLFLNLKHNQYQEDGVILKELMKVYN